MFENGQKWTKWSKTVANFNKNGRTDYQIKKYVGAYSGGLRVKT